MTCAIMAPSPRPTTNRPNTIQETLDVNAVMRDPIVKRNIAAMTLRLRPKESLNTLMIRAPTIYPHRFQLIATATCDMGVCNCFEIDGSANPMFTISKNAKK